MEYCTGYSDICNQLIHEHPLCEDHVVISSQTALWKQLDVWDRLILNSLPDGVIVLNTDTNICYFNKGAETLTGFQSWQVLNPQQKPSALWNSSLLTSLVRSLVVQTEYDNVEISFVDRLKHSKSVLLSTSLIKQEDQIIGVIGIYRDITRQKLHQQRQHMEDKLSMVSELARGTAHEIRNAICAARGYIQLLQQQIDNNKHKNFVEIALQEINYVNDVVMKLLMTTQPGAPEKTCIPVIAMIQEALHDFDEQLRDGNIRIQYRRRGKYAGIYGDRRQLKQVLHNIIENALQAMPEKGRLTFSICYRREQKMAVLSIRDTGCGITPDRLEQITWPFYTTKPQALGLGLSVCENIVASHGGQLKVDSRVGKWTKVTVSLPMA